MANCDIAAYLKALRPTAVLVNGTCRKFCWFRVCMYVW